MHSPAYYAAACDLLAPDHAAFLLAEYEQQPLGVVVVAMAGATACYLWGASSDRERNRMPNHALQWAGMRWARARGATHYDFWGIPDELGRLATALARGDGSGLPIDALPLDLERLPGTGLWGVYRFKQGFGGDVVRFVGAWDAALDPAGYALYRRGLGARSWLADVKLHGAGRLFRPAPPVSDGESAHAPAHAPAARVVSDAGEWRRLLAELPEPHVLQSWEWGVLKAQTDWRAERVALRSGSGAAAFQFLSHAAADARCSGLPFPALPFTIAYVPKGPVLDWNNLDLVDETLAQMEAHARRKGCDLREDRSGRAGRYFHRQPGAPRAAAARLALPAPSRFSTRTRPIRTLPPATEALLAGMKSKWRYNVNLAVRRGVLVRNGGVADLDAFYELYAETGQRDGFLTRPFDYYRTTWSTFLRAQEDPDNPAGGALLLAEHPDEAAPLAGLFLLRVWRARTWYFYGASSERRRRDMPNYLLQWEALRWSCAQGCTIYDWWGAPTRPDDPADSLQGVWQFKQGFGAELQPHIGAWDFVMNARSVPALPGCRARGCWPPWRRLAGTLAPQHRSPSATSRGSSVAG